jgi:hypothetical protein
MAMTAATKTRTSVGQPIPRQVNVAGVRWNRLTISNGSSSVGGCGRIVIPRANASGPL